MWSQSVGSQVSSSDEKGGGFDVGSAHHGEVAAAIRDHSFAASIIVPAYNEETRIRPLLPTLASAAQAWNYLVLVVCNGCTDRTAEIVRSIPGIYVLEIERPGKPHAVNVAEMVTGEIFPRLYVDADVQTERETFERLMQALQGEAPRAVRPTASYLRKGVCEREHQRPPASIHAEGNGPFPALRRRSSTLPTQPQRTTSRDARIHDTIREARRGPCAHRLR